MYADGIDVLSVAMGLTVIVAVGWVLVEGVNEEVDAITAFCADYPEHHGTAYVVKNITDEEIWYDALVKTDSEGEVSIIEINCTAWNAGEYVAV